MKNPFISILFSLLLLSFFMSAADETVSSARYKLEKLKIENIELRDTKLSDAISIIKDLCKKADPEGKGVNISFMAPNLINSCGMAANE